MALVFLVLISATFIGISQGQMKVGFYSNTCPDAESMVSGVVRNAAQNNPNIAAKLLRLHFHDCFVDANGPSYEVPTGRRDGRVSDVSQAANMPDVSDSIQQLIAKFRQKGLSEKELVLLSCKSPLLSLSPLTNSLSCMFGDFMVGRNSK
ncbi:Plant peroxidase [Corchorus capsularis]|uniref:peroxidase n=1 Tax=Corchorus capsularis TaxID=210143 RepID=A0A1R3IBK1_COCAP|nr:Plant peroxidase [Corchorus capsularis]